MVGSRTGRWTQAYQVQKTIPDRHTAGIITEQMFFGQVFVFTTPGDSFYLALEKYSSLNVLSPHLRKLSNKLRVICFASALPLLIDLLINSFASSE